MSYFKLITIVYITYLNNGYLLINNIMNNLICWDAFQLDKFNSSLIINRVIVGHYFILKGR